MLFYADLHIHSKYSRACSKDCDLEHLAWWAQRKGIGLVGTGDFTHPAWYDHLREMLVPAEPGLFRLRPDVESAVERTLPSALRKPVRFMPSVEISTIYKRDDRTRKVHHLIYFPDLEAVARFNTSLGRIGNLGSDGRPILGLDSRDLLEITLESSPDGYLVPAHIWTPWFSALGSKSGFDAIEDCYADLAEHIFAVETGLSSDPPMNWRVSSLDKYRLVSNSDAHSPPALGREASAFDTDLDYYAVRRALATGDGFQGSLEFFPEEGKYHADGHRKCDVRLDPAETRAHQGRCPECGKPLTVGVLHRVEALADRPDGERPDGAAGYRNFIQLPEIMGEILGVGPKSKSVMRSIDDLVSRHGSELTIVTETPVDDLARATPMLAEAVARLRRGDVIREAGYDGEYGVIRLFEPGELDTTGTLFELDLPEPAKPQADKDELVNTVAAAEAVETEAPTLPGTELTGLLDALDPDQRAAASAVDGSVLIIAGPGTGKTRTLTHRIAHLVSDLGVPATQCLAITFTRRAAEELGERLGALVPGQRPLVTTFHGLGLRILREHPELAGLSPAFKVADDTARVAILEEVLGPRVAQLDFDRLDDEAKAQYQKAMRARDLLDVGELVRLPVDLLTEHPALAERYRERWRYVSVDEYQDVDETQYRLLRLLVPSDGNLCAIGDPDQAIYRFRGADVGFFLRFGDDYPAATTVRLNRNYRSTRPILTAAGQAIAPSTLVPDRALSPVRRDPDVAPVRLHQAETAEAEASFVARTIDQLLGGSSHHSLDSGRVDSREDAIGGLSFSDIAVLYRTDVQARALVEAFTQSGVPFQKRSHDRLSDRPAVQDIARELRYADSEGAGAGSLADRIRLVARVLVDRMSAIDDPREVHQAVDLLMPLAARCDDSAERLLVELATGVEVDSLDPRADAVSLLTLHASKGLEFPVVFVVGCEDGLLPFRYPGQELSEDEVAEERRLFFVGMTRAQSHLFLSHAKQRLRHGGLREQNVSPFLSAIGAGVLERVGEPARQRPRIKQQKLF
ncbi:UvrD-helicase domain-containing protein [Flindersiella endophytica]